MTESTLLAIRVGILLSGIVLVALFGSQLTLGNWVAHTHLFDQPRLARLPIPHLQRQLVVKILQGVLIAVCVAAIAFMLIANLAHLTFPFHLNLKEGVLLQHLDRLMRGQPVYPEPTPAFVPLAYNIGYYLITAPFAAAFGTTLFSLRLVATLGNLLSALFVFLVVRRKTQSRLWGLLALGLFAAAYGVMEAYLDTASSDSWLLALVLLGTWLIDANRSKTWNLLGVLALVASFWVKQHGALFVLGGLAFLAWRDGWRMGLVYGAMAVVLGPVLYIFAAPSVLGSHYHYFTWVVPRTWSELTGETFVRFGRFIFSRYFFLALFSALFVFWLVRRRQNQLCVWHAQWVSAVAAGFLGVLDRGSANNVLIPMQVWFIIVGVWGAKELANWVRPAISPNTRTLRVIGLVVSFGVLLYNPFAVIPSRHAQVAYQDFVQTVQQLDGQVYAPYSGFISSDLRLYPNAHWIALEDMVRRPGEDGEDAPLVRQMLKEVTHPAGKAYLITNARLDEVTPILFFLEEYYVLEQDFGNRFEALGSLPDRYFQEPSFPRYLYRHK